MIQHVQVHTHCIANVNVAIPSFSEVIINTSKCKLCYGLCVRKASIS